MPFKKFQIFFTLPQTPAPFCPSGTKTANPGMPVHSGGGRLRARSRLILGAGFLLARGRMRWRTGDTCLSRRRVVSPVLRP